MRPLRWLALIICAAFGVVGCGTAMSTTVKTENTLVLATSQLSHMVDGADSVMNAATRAKLDAGDRPGARALYSQYKPKIEKGRASVHTSQDTIDDAEAVRAKIPTGGDTKQYEAWLPALSAALVGVEQAISEIKGLVK